MKAQLSRFVLSFFFFFGSLVQMFVFNYHITRNIVIWYISIIKLIMKGHAPYASFRTQDKLFRGSHVRSFVKQL
jgi:hypothetical protein